MPDAHPPPSPHDPAGLPDHVRSDLETALALVRTAEAPEEEQRHRDRLPYIVPGLRLLVTHPGGNRAELYVVTRDLAAGGAGFLHSRFLHPGSRCSIELRQRDGSLRMVPGEIVHCSHLSGMVHNVGMEFGAAIDVEAFVSPETSADGG